MFSQSLVRFGRRVAVSTNRWAISSRWSSAVAPISADACWDAMTEHTKALALGITTEKETMKRRVALSRAITLMESKNTEKKQQGDYLLTYLMAQQPDHQQPTLRIGFAGPPGAGKSSMVEAFGSMLLENDPDLHLGVVCIDPSSGISGGSILGDKTRMTELSVHERAYVRPSSNSGVLGGLSAYTDDVVSTMSVAGYPVVLVETVGLGQSEIEVIESVDVLVLLLSPGGGDELQGVKKGIVELANILAVTKADGKLLETAKSTLGDYKRAITVLQMSSSSSDKGWRPPVLLTSSATMSGLDKLWETIQEYRAHLESTGKWEERRKQQSQYWMWKQFTRMMQTRMRQDPTLAKHADMLESKLLKGLLTPRVAAQEMLDGMFNLAGKKD